MKHLYNIVKDPGEVDDLSIKDPKKLKDLKTAWAYYADTVGVVEYKP